MEQITNFDQFGHLPHTAPVLHDMTENLFVEELPVPQAKEKIGTAVALVAHDLVGLDSQRAADVVLSMIDLALSLGCNAIVVENIDVLRPEPSEEGLAKAVSFLEAALEKADMSGKVDISNAELQFDGSRHDIRVEFFAKTIW